MCVVRLRVSVGLWFPRSPTVSATFEFTPQFPIPAAIGTVPLRSVSRFLPRENVIGVLYRAEPLVPYPFRKVRGSAVKGIWVVHPNEFIIFRKTALESVSTRKASAVSLVKLTSIFHLFLIHSPYEVKDLVGRWSRV